ncbi:MAG: hypothetical protein ACXABY_31690 [Candidatus Thorarchaeota archaeon]|jgi:hypothetical protein
MKEVCYWCELESTNKGLPKPDVPAVCKASGPLFEGKYACRGHGDLLMIAGWYGGLLEVAKE